MLPLLNYQFHHGFRETFRSGQAEVGKFADALAKTQKKLQEASNTVDAAATSTRAIERRLRGVEALPADANRTARAIRGARARDRRVAMV